MNKTLKQLTTVTLTLAIILAILPAVAPSGKTSAGYIAMDRTRNKASIVAMAQRLSHTGFDYEKTQNDYVDSYINEHFDDIFEEFFDDDISLMNRIAKEYIDDMFFEETPEVKAPYKAGRLKQAHIDDALNAIKMVRYIAGLPYDDIVMSNALNRSAQHRTVLAAAYGAIGHELPKPADMSDEFYQNCLVNGKDICDLCGMKGSSPYIPAASTAGAILGLVGDNGAENISTAGHRHAILNPGVMDFGVGFVNTVNDGPGELSELGELGGLGGLGVLGGLLKSNNYYYVHHPEHALTPMNSIDTYLAWPNSGDFPIQYFTNSANSLSVPEQPWSLSLGAAYQPTDKKSASLTLTRVRDSKAWYFSSGTPSLSNNSDYLNSSLEHFAVNGRTITFRPDLKSLGPILDGDVFEVYLTGIKTASGSPTTLTYWIDFFDLEEAMKYGPYTPVQGRMDFSYGSEETRTLTLVPSMTTPADKRVFGLDTYYNDAYFNNKNAGYDHGLATMTLALAMSAFNSCYAPGESYKASAAGGNVKALMENCGFSKINISSYEGKPTDTSIAAAFGSKYFYDMETGKPYTLIAVAVRGGGYEKEWIGNYDLSGNYQYHDGFMSAAVKVREMLYGYVDSNGITGPVKLWLTGYSRGAATANLLASMLVDGDLLNAIVKLEPDDLYAYTFATPQNTKDPRAHDKKYEKIYNIINPLDVVTKVAMSDWGYTRYGTSIELPCDNVDAYIGDNRFEDVAKDVLGYMYAISGVKSSRLPMVTAQGLILDSLLSGICLATLPLKEKSPVAQNFLDYMRGSILKKSELAIFNEVKDSIEPLFSADIIKANYIDITSGMAKFLIDMFCTIVAQNHYPSLYLAWMLAIDDSCLPLSPGEFRKLTVACPVDVYVYGSGSKLVAEIINDAVTELEDSYISAYVNDSGEKIVLLPGDEKYTVRIEAAADGVMSYRVDECRRGSAESVNKAEYRYIPIHEGDVFTGTFEKLNSTSPADYPLYDRAGDPVSGTNGLPFTDVSEADWFYNNVRIAYESGLINGTSPTTFSPNSNLTYAEAVKLAACMHQLRVSGAVTLTNGDPWYSSYADYARDNGIIFKDYDWERPATRADHMVIFANALPGSDFAVINVLEDGAIPDVPATHPAAAEIYMLYRAGIVQGVDEARNCKPETSIRRSEVAAILTRMMYSSERIPFE